MDTAFNAAAAVAAIATAVGTLGTAQGNVGALENRLQFAIGLAQSQSVNNQAAESRIRDANIAEESANMTKFNILTQSGIAALSQANQSSQSVLSLLQVSGASGAGARGPPSPSSSARTWPDSCRFISGDRALANMEGMTVSSPITLSNFNSIDFSVILNAVMAQASQPLTALQNQQTDLATENKQYNVLATKLGSLETAAAGLSTSECRHRVSPRRSATRARSASRRPATPSPAPTT